MNKKLRKSVTDKSISGVCGGIAEYFGISSFMARLLFIFLPAIYSFISFLLIHFLIVHLPYNET